MGETDPLAASPVTLPGWLSGDEEDRMGLDFADDEEGESEIDPGNGDR